MSAIWGCVGLRFDPFEVTETVVDDLLPGERLEYEYAMSAFTNFFGPIAPDGAAGVAAFYGDPLEIGGGSSSFVIHDRALTLTLAPVPLPGTLGLMLPGLLRLKRRTKQQSPRISTVNNGDRCYSAHVHLAYENSSCRRVHLCTVSRDRA